MSALHVASLGLLLSTTAFATPDAPVAPVAPVARIAAELPAPDLDLADTDSVRQAIRHEVSRALAAELAEVEGLRLENEALRKELEQLKEEEEGQEEGSAIVIALDTSDLDSGSGLPRIEHHIGRWGGNHREAVSFGSNVVVPAGTTVDEAASFGGTVEISGTVTGDASSFGGDVVVRQGGKVLGDATSIGGAVRIEPGGQVLGEADTLGGTVVVEPGGQIHATSGVVIAPAAERSWFGGFFESLYRRLVFLLAFAGAGVMIVALFPERVGRVADALREQPLKAGLAGLGWTLGILLASVLFFWTIIGPIVGLAVIGLAWMIGFVGLCQFLGDRLPFGYKPHGRWIAFLVGCVVMSFLGALPWIGVLTVIGASVFGIGAAFVSRMGSR